MTIPEYKANQRLVIRLSEILLQVPLDELLDLHQELLNTPHTKGDPEGYNFAQERTRKDANLLRALVNAASVHRANREEYPEEAKLANALWAAKMAHQLSL